MLTRPSLASARIASRPASLAPVLASIAFLLAGAAASAYQSSAWKHASSEHFTVSYDQRSEARAGQALSIAEETRDALIRFLGEFPSGKRISIVLDDSADEPNGWSSDRVLLVHVDCRQAQGLLRGQADWLRTVLTHELSHAYSLAMMRSPIELQLGAALSSVDEGVEASASYLLGDDRAPIWFIEGLAQMGSDSVGADSRDAVREMVLRDAALGGRLLDLKRMSRFEGSSLESELAYNQGYSLLKYLESSRPDVPLSGLCALIKKKGFASAFRIRYGESPEDLYGRWKEDLLSRARARAGGELPAGVKVFDRDGPYVLETASASGTAYVAANWGNDYERFGIFARGKAGTYARIADYSGAALKADRETGEIWFAKSVYDMKSGVDAYDLYSLPPGGRPARATKGARCLAFDAVGGHLIYARYSDGTTEVVSRRPDGAETVLAAFPYGYSVESVSAVARDKALLSIGTAEGPRAAVAADGSLRFLWPGSDVSDLAFAGADRAVFSSSIEGSPQIYWADLAEDPSAWYRITDAPAGCRFPSVESGESGAVLYYSRYESGGFRLYRLDDPFSTERPLRIEGEPVDDRAPDFRPRDDFAGRTVAQGNPVVDLSPITLGVDVARSGETSFYPYAGLGFSAFDAPEDLGIDLSLGLIFPVEVENAALPWLSLGVDGVFAVGAARCSAGYSLNLQSYEESGDKWSYADNRLSAGIKFQLASDQELSLRYSMLASVYDDPNRAPIDFYALNSLGLTWSLGKYLYSRFDPADLGGDWLSAWLGAVGAISDVKDRRFYSPSYITGARPFLDLEGELAFHSLLAGGKLGLGGSLYGLGILNAVSGAKVTPAALASIGGSGSFSGYPDGYAGAVDLAMATLEISVNPFVDGDVKTRPIERASLALKLEAGWARCFTGVLETGWPLSIEARLRHRFYESPNRLGTVYGAFAMPLNDFMGSLEDPPFRIYAGYEY